MNKWDNKHNIFDYSKGNIRKLERYLSADGVTVAAINKSSCWMKSLLTFHLNVAKVINCYNKLPVVTTWILNQIFSFRVKLYHFNYLSDCHHIKRITMVYNIGKLCNANHVVMTHWCHILLNNTFNVHEEKLQGFLGEFTIEYELHTKLYKINNTLTQITFILCTLSGYS